MRAAWTIGIVCLVILGVLQGCPSTGPTKNDGGGQEVPTETTKLRSLSEPLEAKETRAGQMTKAEDMIKGPLALNQVGDWKLYNKYVAFALHKVTPSRTWTGSQGQLIDASPVDDKGIASSDQLEELTSLFVYTGLRVIKATKIEVISAGGVDKDAHIRVTAIDVGVPILDMAITSKKIDVPIHIDYILKPDAKRLEITTKVGDGRIKPIRMCDGVMLGSQTRFFSPIAGWDVGSSVGKQVPWIAGVGKNVSYLLTHKDTSNSLSILLQQDAIIPVLGKTGDDADAEVQYTRYLYVGRGSLDEVLTMYKAQKNETALKTWAGQITGLQANTRAELQLLDDKGKAINHAYSDIKGVFSLQAPAGTYTLKVQAPGHDDLTYKDGPSDSIKLDFAPASSVQFNITETAADGTKKGFVPVRLELQGPQTLRVNVIEQNQLIPLKPGTYKATISRGLEYEYVQVDITLKAGDKKTQDVELVHSIEPIGYVGGDMHLHASPSADSDLPLQQRVGALVAEGLQFAASSDHDTSYDYMPLVRSLKLTPYIKTVAGEEVSPLPFHTNAYPIQKPTDAPLYFAIPWATYQDNEYTGSLLGPAIWKLLRDNYQAQIIQLNHPRDKGQGYLNHIDYDATKGVKALKANTFDGNWDAIELYNGSGRDTFLNTVLQDWFSLLNQGYMKTAVGNSDSHSDGSRPGIPRTLIGSKERAGDKLSTEEVIKQLKAGNAMVYAGPYIKVTTKNNAPLGATINAKSLEVTIELQAPSWISVSYLKIYANGKLLQKVDVSESKERSRLKQAFTFTPTKDTWYVFMAGDDSKGMEPVYPGRKPISMTNPLYLDIDGNGFKAPGLE
ncbi:MAG: hypothetical protein CL920_10645 [Deltaproteobacteria bacterium]|nr:hypothetical protein [Deltaproteobacteria bacterium]MBU49144.1 hypothetical protein [Deltaproteobacteria bacterium]|tara:strand:+ start:264 stop:2792 length:2529 start_codon:yes stop_codon:yes gene_type:complete